MARTFPDPTASRLAELCVMHLRAPAQFATDSTTGAPVLDFDPPLTGQEQTTYDLLLALARSETTRLTPTDYATVREQLQVLRALRQLGRNAFMALTAAERDRMIYEALVAVTILEIGQYREALQASAQQR